MTSLAVLAGTWTLLSAYAQRETQFGIARWKRRLPVVVAACFYIALIADALQ